MTTGGFSFRLAALCACVMASCTFAISSDSPSPECEANKNGEMFLFVDCKVTNFSAHLPVPPSNVIIGADNAAILDIDGCVRWLSHISQLSGLYFRGNDLSFLDCLAEFNRSLPVTRTSGYNSIINIGRTTFPLDDWIETNFKTLFGSARHWESVTITDALRVTRVPEAFGNQGVINLNQLKVMYSGVSVIRKRDLNGYRFVKVSSYYETGLFVSNNRICVVELAAFRNVPYVDMAGNPIDEKGSIDWKQLANRYPNAIAVGTNPVCARALDTTCFQAIDTSYSGISIMKRVCILPPTAI